MELFSSESVGSQHLRGERKNQRGERARKSRRAGGWTDPVAHGERIFLFDVVALEQDLRDGHWGRAASELVEPQPMRGSADLAEALLSVSDSLQTGKGS